MLFRSARLRRLVGTRERAGHRAGAAGGVRQLPRVIGCARRHVFRRGRYQVDFRLTEEQEKLRDAARDFATGEMVEVARRLEAEDEALPKEWIKRYAEMGFLGINVAERSDEHTSELQSLMR